MERPVRTRLGDGSLVEMTLAEVREDLLAGTEIGARRAKVTPLTEAEIDHRLDIFSTESKLSAVADLADPPPAPWRRRSTSSSCRTRPSAAWRASRSAPGCAPASDAVVIWGPSTLCQSTQGGAV